MFDADRVARALHVPSKRVVDGLFGLVECDPPISYQDASDGTGIVTVAGQSDPCLALFVRSNALPSPGQTFDQVAVACPAPALPEATI